MTVDTNETQQTDKKDSQRTDVQGKRLHRIAQEIRVFKTPSGDVYGRVRVGSAYQNHLLRSPFMRGYITVLYDDLFGSAPSSTAVDNALNALAGRASISGETREVFVRVAHDGDTIYLDLCDDSWDAVRITAAGWDFVHADDMPVRFRRPNGALPLPRPKPGGTLEDLKQLINAGSTDDDWVLIIAWLLGTLHPTGPYPDLAFIAEQGSGKSVTSRYLRGLVDPSSTPLSKQPRDSDALTLKAHNNWILAFDNMSGISDWLSNDLCRLATGGGDSKRKLYADSEEVSFNAKRPVILNGITELVTQPDLMERTLLVNLPRITARKSEAELDALYEKARARILGALLDAASMALRRYRTIELPFLPRMADFALLITAAEPALGWKPGTFLAAYDKNQKDATSLQIEASPVASAVLRFMAARQFAKCSISAQDLLDELKKLTTDESVWRLPGWPKDAARLGGKLRQVVPVLRRVGVDVAFAHSGDRFITLSRYAPDDEEGLDGTDSKLQRSYISSEDKEEVEEEEKGCSAPSTLSKPSDGDAFECITFPEEDAACDEPDNHIDHWRMLRDDTYPTGRRAVCLECYPSAA